METINGNYLGTTKALNLEGQVEFNRRKNVAQDQQILTLTSQVQTILNQRPSGFLPKVYYGLTRGEQKYRFTRDTIFTITGLTGNVGSAYEIYSLNDSNYIPAIAVQNDSNKIKITIEGDYNNNANTFNLINMVDGTILNITLTNPLSLQDASFLGSYSAQSNEGKQITVLNNLETKEQNVVFGSVDFNNDGTYNWIKLGSYTNGIDGKAMWSCNSSNINSILDVAKVGDSIVSAESFVKDNISFLIGDIYEITLISPLSGALIGNIRGLQGEPGIQGPQGNAGTDGATPTIINNNWWINGIDTGVPAIGQNGTNGQNGQSFQMKSGLYSTPSNYGKSGNVGPTGETLQELPTLPQTSGLTGNAYVVYDPLTTPLNPYYDLYYANDNDNNWTIMHPFSGLKGEDGKNGYTPYIQSNTWYINGVSTGISAVGPQGIQGEKGLNPMGEWVANNEHFINDLVTYNGSAYICIQDHNNVDITPDLDTVDWLLFVSKGNKGDIGNDAGFGIPTATIDSNSGTPSVNITSSGPNTAKVFNFEFKNLKGQQGIQGEQGPTGATGAGVPSGGTAGQYLKKNSSTNYDTTFQSPDTSPTNGSSNLITSGGVYASISTKANLDASNLSNTNIENWQKTLSTISKISFSRYMRWETTTSTAQEGWQYCSFTSVSDGTSGNLADNEFITSVDLTSAGAGQYDNRCIPFNCGFTFTNSGLTVHWWRELNDGNNYLRIIAIVCKYE